MTQIELPGDSGDYHLLTKGIELSRGIAGMTCEIGLRRGGGTKIIIDALVIHGRKIHIAIDPYGSIEYEHKEGDFVRLDYTNEMRDECMSNIYEYIRKFAGVQFYFFNLEDTEFFKRYNDGIPVYSTVKTIENSYSFVHYDGPHSVKPLQAEIDFFLLRTPVGACWVFDDVTNYYDHDIIEKRLFKSGFNLIEKGYHKALYQYEG